MSKVSHYFCIFCDFTCERYENALYHYNLHIFVNRNCEICDYNKLVLYNADPSDLGVTCFHECYRDRNTQMLSQEEEIKIEVIHYWVNVFLSYQQKILDNTYEKLLLANKVCAECAVCRYLVAQYKSNGGDMNQIHYINDNKVEHCYQHMRYNPESGLINAYIAKCKNRLRVKRILKLEVFVEQCCDTFFTDNKNSVSNIGNSDQKSISDVNECLSCSEATETFSQSPNFEDILQQLSVLDKTVSEIEIIKSESKESKIEFENKLVAIKDVKKIAMISKATQFYIQNIDTGLVLDIKDWNREPFAAIQMYTYHGGRNQLWEYNHGMIHSALNNFALDVNQGDGKSVITYPANGEQWQKWHFYNDNTIRSEFRNLVLDVEGGDRNKCAKVTANHKHNRDNQLFRIVYV